MQADRAECIEATVCDTRMDGGLPIVAVYNASGTKLVAYTYDAWGNHTVTYYNAGTATAAIKNPFRYRGYYYDSDIGLYYLNSRYYDANTGRFINADGYISTGQGILGYNMYAYCGNNPVNYVDYSGTSPLGIVMLFVLGLGTVILLTSCGVKDIVELGQATEEFSEDLQAHEDYIYEYSNAVVEYNITNNVPQNNTLIEVFDGDEQLYISSLKNDAEYMKLVIDEEYLNDVDYLAAHFPDWAPNAKGKIAAKSGNDALESGFSLYKKVWDIVIGVAE